MPSAALPLRFALHDGEWGRDDPARVQPPVRRIESAWSAAQIEAVFSAEREAWFDPSLAPYADHIAAVLAQERLLSERWNGLPGTDHPAHWDGTRDSLARAQPQPRSEGQVALWHPPLAWVMPLVRRRPRELDVRLPLAASAAALEALARSALPPGWERHRVTVRLEIETRVYWGARSVQHAGRWQWKPCRRRGAGLSHSLELFTLHRGRCRHGGAFNDEGLSPPLRRRLAGGVGLLVAIPVLSFERQRRWRQVVDDRWRHAWRRIGWVRRDDRDPTFVQRLEGDERFWNAATGAAPMRPEGWRRALHDGAVLRPANARAARHAHTHAARAGNDHVVLLHGGLASARGAFQALMAPTAPEQALLWPGMPLLDELCTWRFEHDSFVPIRHNIDRLLRWLQREVVRDDARGNVVLIAHSRGGNVARFALPVLRERLGPGWTFSALTAGAPHLGTRVFSRVSRRWAALTRLVRAVREVAHGWLDREQLAQLVIIERGLAYQVPPGFHDCEPEGVLRLSHGRPHELPEGLFTWGSQWGTLGKPGRARPHRGLNEGLWDWLVEALGGAEIGGDGLVARDSALAGRRGPAEGAHDASPVFHTQYFAHGPTREEMSRRLAALVGRD